MATLLNAVTVSGAGTGASHSGPATVFVRGTFDGARVLVQIADENVSASYVKADNITTPNPARLEETGAVTIDGKGTYFIRCFVDNAGSSTSITAVSTQ